MATRKKINEEVWPRVVKGSHSVRTEHEDGRIEFTQDWDALARDVSLALANQTNTVVQEKPKRTKRSRV